MGPWLDSWSFMTWVTKPGVNPYFLNQFKLVLAGVKSVLTRFKSVLTKFILVLTRFTILENLIFSPPNHLQTYINTSYHSYINHTCSWEIKAIESCVILSTTRLQILELIMNSNMSFITHFTKFPIPIIQIFNYKISNIKA